MGIFPADFRLGSVCSAVHSESECGDSHTWRLSRGTQSKRDQQNNRKCLQSADSLFQDDHPNRPQPSSDRVPHRIPPHRSPPVSEGDKTVALLVVEPLHDPSTPFHLFPLPSQTAFSTVSHISVGTFTVLPVRRRLLKEPRPRSRVSSCLGGMTRIFSQRADKKRRRDNSWERGALSRF